MIRFRKDAGRHCVDPPARALDSFHAEVAVGAWPQHCAINKNLGHHLRVVSYRNFELPYLRRDQPFPFGAFAFSPSGAIIYRAILCNNRVKPRIAMLLDEQANLRNGGLDFTSLHATPAVAPGNEASTRCFHCLPLLPRDNLENARKFASSSDQTEAINDAEDLTVSANRCVILSEGINHRFDFIGLNAFGN